MSQCPVVSEELEESMESVRQKEIETIMKLFALACKSDHESRAIEVAQLLPSVETIQLAIQYAAKMRRVGLAEKLGKLAMEKQEEEEATQEDTDNRAELEDGESQDMFEATQENPLLAAAAKRANNLGNHNNLNITSQGKQESRNPFAKKTAAASVSSPSQSGIVFDSLKSERSSLINNREKSGFGQRKIVLNNQDKTKKTVPAKGGLFAKEKENRSENTTSQLKGFQLYYAENKDNFDDESSALVKWKSLDKSSKDSYQVPRLPNTDQAKRKRSEDDDLGHDKRVKSDTNTKQKLAGFAFGN